ncbi:PriCT-2 domain-containing protein [Robbsia andropogonis]|uniref:PriCT-2 domain-containing protein n=1 Tax=Robbsia andropogonis TaxID=28092 RepID=UPI003D25ED9B
MIAAFDEQQRISAALACIPADVERDTWFRVAAAIKHELGDDGFETFDSWSRRSDSYVPTDARDTWRSLHADRGITAGTLFSIAKRYGFDPAQIQSSTIDPAVAQQDADERARRARASEAKRSAEQRTAADLARSIWAAATEATADLRI